MSQDLNTKEFTKEELALMAGGVVIVGTSAYIGSQVLAGVFIGAITAGGITYTIYKTRTHAPRLFNMICKRPLASDILIDAGVFILIGGTTVTAFTAGASASLFTSIGLCCLRKLGKVEIPQSRFMDIFKKTQQPLEVVIVQKA